MYRENSVPDSIKIGIFAAFLWERSRERSQNLQTFSFVRRYGSILVYLWEFCLSQRPT